MRLVVSKSLQGTGISKSVFGSITNALKPENLKGALGSIDGILESFKGGFNSILILAGNFLQGVRAGLSSIDPILSSIKTSVAASFGLLNTLLQASKEGINALASSGGIIDNILTTISTSITGISPEIDAIASAINFVNLNIQDASSSVDGFISAIQTQIPTVSATLTNFIGNFQSMIAPSITDAIGFVDNAIAGLGVGGWGGLGEGFNDFIDNLRSGIEPLVSGTSGYIDAIAGIFTSVGDGVAEFLNDSLGFGVDKLGEFVDFIADNVIPGIENIFNSVDEFFGNIFSDAFSEVGRNANNAFARGFLGAGFQNIAPALDAIDGLILNINENLSTLASRLSEPIDSLSNIPGAIAGFNEPLEVLGLIEGTVGQVVSGMFAVTEKIAFFSQGLSALQQFVATGPFQALVGQTIEFRQQLLSIQSSLVGVSKVFNQFTGEPFKDATAAIKGLEAPVKQVVETMRVESLELVGVTSKELVPLFQQVAGEISQVGGGLNDAKNLALDFAASLNGSPVN